MHPVDDDSAVALLRPLDGEPATASTIDVDRAVREGRRLRRRRTTTRAVAMVAATGLVIAGGAAAAITLRGGTPDDPGPAAQSASASSSPPPKVRKPPLTGAAPAPPTQCQLSPLPMPAGMGGLESIVTGADPSGKIIVGRVNLGDGDKQAIMWRDGKVEKLPLIGGDPALNDVDAAGTAVGVEYGEAGQLPVAYRDGAVKRMSAELGGTTGGEARGINEAGVVAGMIVNYRTPPVAVRWASIDARPEALPLPPGVDIATARDIDEDGTIVGFLGEQTTPYVWFADGEHHPLPLPPLDGKPATGGDAMSIRNGWVSGMATYGMGRYRAVRWNVHTGEVTLFPDIETRAAGVNAHGWQVGSGKDGNGILRTDRGALTLPGLTGRNPALLGVIAKTVSDDARTIAGQSTDSADRLKAVKWSCS